MRAYPLALTLLLGASPAMAQQVFPTATTVEALTAYPIFFHARPVTVVGEFARAGDATTLTAPGGKGRPLDVLWHGPVDERPGPVEVRGLFLDVGRLAPGDPQAAADGVTELARSRVPDGWPAHGDLLAVVVWSVLTPTLPASAPTLQALALAPQRYAGQHATVWGQFGGRNLFGDAPRSPGTSRQEFIVRNAGAAVWITGLRPEGKRWALDPDSRLDTDVWLQVTGIVREGSGLVWIEGASVQPTTPRPAEPERFTLPAAVPGPPPKVVFTVPAADDTDVPTSSTVKFQVSRDLDAASLAGQVTAMYEAAGLEMPPIEFTATWDRERRVLEVRFAEPLERFRTVRVDLRAGIKGTDGQPLVPCHLTFTVGGH